MSNEPPPPPESGESPSKPTNVKKAIDLKGNTAQHAVRGLSDKVKREGKRLRKDIKHAVIPKRKRKVRLRPFHIAIALSISVCIALFFVALRRNEYDGIALDRAKAGLAIILGAWVIFLCLWALGVIHYLLKNDRRNGIILLSPEVVAVVAGSVISLGVGSFAVNNLLERSAERQVDQRIQFDKYERKVELLERFSDKTQEILFYGYMYRVAEEWLIAYDKQTETEAGTVTEDSNTLGQSKGVPFFVHTDTPLILDELTDQNAIAMLVERYDEISGIDSREAIVKIYYEYLNKFVEAGSVESMCIAIETYFDDEYNDTADAPPDDGLIFREAMTNFRNNYTKLIYASAIKTNDDIITDRAGEHAAMREYLSDLYSNELTQGYRDILKRLHKNLKHHRRNLQDYRQTLYE